MQVRSTLDWSQSNNIYCIDFISHPFHGAKWYAVHLWWF